METKVQKSTEIRPHDLLPSLSEMNTWMKAQMPLTNAAAKDVPNILKRKIAFSLHLDPKVIPGIQAFIDQGAEVFVLSCNPRTTRLSVVSALQDMGASVIAEPGMTLKDNLKALEMALDWGPEYLCEMGGDLSFAYHQRQDQKLILGSVEATGSGIRRLESLDLRYPVFNWDDVQLKEGLHNRFLVGLVTWNTFFNRTFLSLHRKKVSVLGFGLVGHGVAEMARAYGGLVQVVEPDAARRFEAEFRGFASVTLQDALEYSDVIVTATGKSEVLSRKELNLLRSGVFLLNVGHEDQEIDLPYLNQFPRKEILPHVEEIDLNGRKVYLFARGSMANLTAGHGDSLNTFDITSALMIRALSYLICASKNYAPGLHLLPSQAYRDIQ